MLSLTLAPPTFTTMEVAAAVSSIDREVEQLIRGHEVGKGQGQDLQAASLAADRGS